MLTNALPLIYRSAHLICLSLDINRRSWSGNVFVFDEVGFREMIREIDRDGKIVIYQDDFFEPSLTPMGNEIRQRRMMADYMKPGGWHVQLDCDEYFVDFGKFVKYLFTIDHTKHPVNVCCAFITLFKRLEGGYLFISPRKSSQVEFLQIASRTPSYEHGRRNGYFNIYTNFYVLHQSWARSHEEILQKIANWGHAGDFDQAAFFSLWSNAGESNYHSLSNFHPIEGALWPSLSFVPANSPEEIADDISGLQFPRYSRIALLMKNSRVFAKVRAYLNGIIRS